MIVTADLAAELHTPYAARALAVCVQLGWRDTDPLAVQLVAWIGHPVVWTFARDLLAAGLVTAINPPGGDVRVQPGRDRNRTQIWLSAPEGSCVLVVDRVDVQMLLERTWMEVPPCAEVVPIPDTATEFLAQLDGTAS